MISVDYRLIGRALHETVAVRDSLRTASVGVAVTRQPAAGARRRKRPRRSQHLPAETPPAPAVTEDPLAEAVAHLEYLGYEVELEPDGWSYARHPYRYNFCLRTFPHGIKLHCEVEIGASMGNSRAAWIDFLNKANDRGHVTPILIGRGRERCLPSQDARARHRRLRSESLAMVMDMWHDDVDLVRRRPEFPLERLAEAHEEGAAVTVN